MEGASPAPETRTVSAPRPRERSTADFASRCVNCNVIGSARVGRTVTPNSPWASPRSSTVATAVSSPHAATLVGVTCRRSAGSTRTMAVTESMRARGQSLISTESPGDRATIEIRWGCSVPVKCASASDRLSEALAHFTGTEQPQRISIVARSPGDSVEIKLWPLARIDSVTAMVRVLPALRLQVTPTRVAAWGLETAVATVELLGDAHGEFGVTVRPTRADPMTLQFTHRDAKSAVLRSRGLGADTVRVSGAGLAPSMTVVTYVFPFALLIALALGSTIGTTALQLSPKTRSTAPWWAFLRGLLLGLVAVAAYAVGVKAIPVPIPAQVGEGGSFVVAALASYLGLRKR